MYPGHNRVDEYEHGDPFTFDRNKRSLRKFGFVGFQKHSQQVRVVSEVSQRAEVNQLLMYIFSNKFVKTDTE